MHEEAIIARHLPGFRPSEMYCSEFSEAVRALIDMLERESPVVSDRDAVDREMRRLRR